MKKIIKFLLVFTVLLFMIGVSSASEVHDNTTDTNNFLTNEITTDTYTTPVKNIDTKTDKTSNTLIPTKIDINYINDTRYTEESTISGTYQDLTGRKLRYTPLNVSINNEKLKTQTNTDGIFTFKYKTKQVGTNNITISFSGNTKFEGTTTSTTFKVTPQTTTITINHIPSVQYSESVTISGKYTDTNNLNLRYTPLTINVNGKKYTTRTDENGFYQYNYRTTTSGLNNVTISYPGNVRYLGTSTATTFQVKTKDTILSLNPLKNAQYSDYINITGRYTDKDYNNLRYTPITLNVNGIKYITKTDDNGYFNYNYRVTNLGTNNITASYSGNSRYTGASNSTSFQVTSINTTITLNPIPETLVGDNVTITGKYIDANGNPLRKTSLTLVVNDEKTHVRTDENGVYSFNYITCDIGENTITLFYAGTEKYVGTQTYASFIVKSDNTINHLFKTRKTMVASVFVSDTVTQTDLNKWVESGITDVYVLAIESSNSTGNLRKTINLCKNTNIKVHAWIVVFVENHKWDYSIKTQNKMKKFISYVMTINGVEGICLDYIRYSGLNPSIVNVSMINGFVKDVNNMAKKYDSRMEISACILPEIKSLKYYYGQDTKTIEKHVDFMILMAYKNNYYEDTAWMVDVTKSLVSQCTHAKVVTSLTTYSDLWGRKYLPMSEMTGDINAIMKAGSYGYSLFSKATTPVYPKIF